MIRIHLLCNLTDPDFYGLFLQIALDIDVNFHEKHIKLSIVDLQDKQIVEPLTTM